MPALYQNYESLIAHGQVRVRKDALAIIQAGIERAIPYDSTCKLIRLDGNIMTVGGHKYDLSEVKHIYIVGAGKGAWPIAKALDDILGDKITDGIVIVKEGEKRTIPHCRTFESSHPIPDIRSVEAAKKMVEVLQKAGKDDIVFAPITGGSSALVNMPLGDITIEELTKINTLLLRCGAPIGDVNAVRKHICGIKGGRVVQMGQPASVITLTLDTAPPDMPWPDMSLPDPTTFTDAVNVLHTYGIWDQTPESIKNYLKHGLAEPSLETLKSLEGMHHSMYYVADPVSSIEAAAKKAEDLGYMPYILGTALEGEAKDMGIFLAGMAKEISLKGRPFPRPCAIISGGETTVTIIGTPGVGGPNQETSLGFSQKAPKNCEVACVSIDTDGTDGPCPIAGGIADGQSAARAKELGIDLKDVLARHDSSAALTKLGDAIITGHTGTNLMNLRVVVIR